jgi:hypothetical protein
MNQRNLLIVAGLAAVGLLATLYVMHGDISPFTFVVVMVLFAADLIGVYFIMQYGLSHDGLPHVEASGDTESVQKLRQMNAQRLAKIEAGRARAALTAGSGAADGAQSDKPAPKRAQSRRRAAAEASAEAAAE